MTELEDNLDPFSPANAAALNLIMSMRLYDVMLGILNALDHDAANKVVAVHEDGLILNKLPFFIGSIQDIKEEEQTEN